MKNLACKGGEPSLMTVKIATDNPLLDNMDIQKQESKLQKEIGNIKKEYLSKEEKEKEEKRKLIEQ